MSITVETMATGARYTMNRMNDMPDWIPISMFWGFPTMLMVLPILEAMAVAIRYGIGLSLYFRQSRITSGVYISTTMSFTKNALDSAVTITTNTSNFFGVFADDAAFKENLLKNPPSVMFAVTTIIPKSKAIVLKSIADIASSKVRTPDRIIKTAPINAAAGLPTLIPGIRVNTIPVYASTNIMRPISCMVYEIMYKNFFFRQDAIFPYNFAKTLC